MTHKRLNTSMKPIKDPLKTTVKGLSLTEGNVRPMIRQIQSKLVTYGIVSDQEEEFLKRYTDYGQIEQKEAF